MPLYEFVCDDCRQEQELLIRGDTTAQCQSCGSTRLTKLLSVPAAHAAEVRDAGSSQEPAGPCGSGCGCFPQ